MRVKITYEGIIQRRERYFVPEAALRGALINAICHKQYQSGVPIPVSVYEDKLYIANIGCLPENWTVDNQWASMPQSHITPISQVFSIIQDSLKAGDEGLRKSVVLVKTMVFQCLNTPLTR